MNDPIYNKFQETIWHRKLTAAEETELQAWLAAHPEARAAWETELYLSRALDRLREVPVSSNFTARVLQAVERETAAIQRSPAKSRWSWHSFLPKAAFAAVILSLGVLTWHERTNTRREEIARSVAEVSNVASAPGPEILEDFEAVRRLNQAPAPDKELLALMQ